MNVRNAFAAAAAVLLIAGCAQVPTAPAVDAPAGPSFDLGATLGTGDQTDDFGMTTTGFDGEGGTETAPADSAGRGGFTVGSGN